MAAIVATNLKKGHCIIYKGETGQVIGTEHRTPGKGNALVMATIRSFQSGKTKDIRFASSDKVELVSSEKAKLDYSYSDQSGFHFMDESFDTVTLSADLLAGNEQLLIDGIQVEVLYVDGKMVTVEFPPHIELTVAQSAPGVKGDTAAAATKEAVLETGLRVQVPLFINPGDKVKISSEDKKYLGRV
jgi:elongation factor P